MRDHANSLIWTSGGGYVIAGLSRSDDLDVGGNNGDFDFWIFQTDRNGDIQWEQNFGGSNWDEPSSMIRSGDGGYVLAGWTSSSDGDVGGNHGNDDIWIVKVDGTGDLEWEENFGGSYDDHASSIVRASDGGYVVAGSSGSSDGDVVANNGEIDVWVFKLTSDGHILWDRNFGGSGWESASSIIRTDDDGYLVAATSDSSDGDVGGNNGLTDVWILKLDQDGFLEWERNFGGDTTERASSVIQTEDGGYAVTGSSESSSGDVDENNGGSDFWVLKLDNNGLLQWENSFGGSEMDRAYSLIQSFDGGYVLAGLTTSSDGDVGTHHGGSFDTWVVKLDPNGDLQWENTYGGSSWDYPHAMVRTPDGRYTVAGESYSSDGDVGGTNGQGDMWVIELADSTNTSIEAPGKDEFSLRFYPNPVQDRIKVELKGSQASSFTYSLLTLDGRQVRSGELRGKGTHALDVDELAAGSYILKVSGEGSEKVEKFVVE